MSDPDLKILWGQSGGCCSICKEQLIAEKGNDNGKYHVGEMAHIKGEKDTAKRYDSNYSVKDRESEVNRILLCPTCHTKIDKDEDTYTVEVLHGIKEEHVKDVQRKVEELKRRVANVSFAELEVILKYLIGTPVAEGNYNLLPSSEKIKKNNLSSQVDKLIQIGLMQRKQVSEYLNKSPDPNFSQRLRGGFISKYLELKKQNKSGDEIFYELCSFAANSSEEIKIQAAGLAVVAYFFEICDIFEKE